MATILGLDTSIGWAQWTLKGGWPRVWRDLGLFIVVVAVGLVWSLRVGTSTSSVLSTWRMLLMFLQAGLLVILGSARIAAAIRTDFTTRMVESHWLMPVPGAVAINGYIWGPIAHILILCIANFLLGAVVSVGASLSVTSWVMPNIVLIVFSVFCWIGSALCAVYSAGSSGLVTVIMAVIGFSRGAVAVALPGMIVLISPLAGKTIFQSQVVGWEFDTFMATAMVSQIYMGIILYWAAVRKYTQPDQSAFAIIPGLLMLAGWVVVSCIGIANWDAIRPNVLGREGVEDWVILVASLASAMLLALVPIKNSWAPHPRVAVAKALLVTVVAALIVLCLPLVHRFTFPRFPYAMTMTGIIVISFLLLFGQFIRWDRFAVLGGFILLVITWVGPIAIDYTKYVQDPVNRSFAMTEISSFSPLGTLIIIWTSSDAGVRGIAVQAIAALAAVVVGLSITRRIHVPLQEANLRHFATRQ